MSTCFNVQKTHYFSNTVHYCRSSMLRLSQTLRFLQSPSFRQAQSKASFTLQVLMLNSDVLPISDFFGCPFTRSFNCDPYPIHVFTLAIPSETSRMRCCHLAPPHVLPPENNVTCADKTSRANLKNLLFLFLFSHSPLKDLQKYVWFFWDKKMTATPV